MSYLLQHLLHVSCYLERCACLLANLVLSHSRCELDKGEPAILSIDLEDAKICRSRNSLAKLFDIENSPTYP